jgi:hypothetical protein
MAYFAFILTALVATAAPQTLTQKRESLRPEVLITTLAPDALAKAVGASTLEHDTEVDRSEAITVVLSIADCDKGDTGVCNASADLVAYKPDGTVHSEVKNVSLNSRRATTPLKLTATDVTGLYKVVATVRDLNGRRFGTTERVFSVK